MRWTRINGQEVRARKALQLVQLLTYQAFQSAIPLMFLALGPAAIACGSPVVHDGDTIRCGLERIRINPIDAPQLPGSPSCEPARIRELAYSRNPAWCDYQRGEQAGAAQADLLRTGPVMIRRLAIDHYGRTLALTSVNSRDAGTYLLKAALAQRWD